MFEYATAEPLNFLKITPSYNVPIDKKFSKNWLNSLNPRNFSNSSLQQDSAKEEDDEYDYEEPMIVTRKKKTAKSNY